MKEIIKKSIQDALNILKIDFSEEILVEVPANRKNGDFSSNIALKLTKQLKENPLNIAATLVSAIKNKNIILIEIKPPGFINFTTTKDYLIENINKVLSLQDDYGRSSIGEGKNINIEFVSANPTGILHMGNARGGAYGDNLANILEFSGHKVTREYYVNDAGNQIINLGKSIQARYFELLSHPFELPEDGYFGPEIIEIAASLYTKFKDTLIKKDIDFYSEYGVTILLDKIKKVLHEYRIKYDVFTSEKAIRQKNNIPKILDKLTQSGHTYKSEGALWLKSTDYGDTADHVLVKNDETYTYLVPDIDYHINKISRGYTKLIDVLGTDHHGYVARLKASLSALGHNSDILDVKLLQLVRLIRDGQEIKMSKRTGNVITLNDLIEEIGVNATRYMFASRSLDTQFDFDLELAKKKSNENPVYYVSYAYARICTILSTTDHNQKIDNYVTIANEDAYNLLENIYKFEDIVKSSAEKELPHLIANYVYDLASLFHTYYSRNRIICDDEQTTNENINLIKAVKITLGNALKLIGVIAPTKM